MENEITSRERESLDVTLVVKAKHADLWEAAKRLGGQAALARELGINQCIVGDWCNLKSKPSKDTQARVEPKLLALTGKLCDDLFPDKIMDAEFFGKAKSVEVSRRYVENHGGSYSENHEDDSRRLSERIADTLNTLSYREREIIKLRYGIGGGRSYTLEEVGHIFKVSRERVRHIEAMAVRKLQAPSRMKQLAEFIEPYADDEPLHLQTPSKFLESRGESSDKA